MTEQRETHQLEGRRRYEIMCNLEIVSTDQLFMSFSNTRGRGYHKQVTGARCKMMQWVADLWNCSSKYALMQKLLIEKHLEKKTIESHHRQNTSGSENYLS